MAVVTRHLAAAAQMCWARMGTRTRGVGHREWSHRCGMPVNRCAACTAGLWGAIRWCRRQFLRALQNHGVQHGGVAGSGTEGSSGSRGGDSPVMAKEKRKAAKERERVRRDAVEKAALHVRDGERPRRLRACMLWLRVIQQNV